MNLFALILESWLIDGVVHRRVIKARLIKFVLNVREPSKRHRNASSPWQQNANRDPVKKLLDRKNGPELTSHNKTLRDNSVKRKTVDDRKKRSINASCNGRKRKQPISSNNRQNRNQLISSKPKKKSANADRLKRKRQRELARKRKSTTDVSLKKMRLDNNR